MNNTAPDASRYSKESFWCAPTCRNSTSSEWFYSVSQRNKIVFLTPASPWTPPAGRPWRPCLCLLLYYGSLSPRLKENASLSFSEVDGGEGGPVRVLAGAQPARSTVRETPDEGFLMPRHSYFSFSCSFPDVVSLHSMSLHWSRLALWTVMLRLRGWNDTENMTDDCYRCVPHIRQHNAGWV